MPITECDLIQRAKKARIMVIGDLILDRYVSGPSTRDCPEAPVPVLQAESEEARLGGAANVAQILVDLGAEVALLGVVGDDRAGRKIRRMLRSVGIDDGRVVADPTRPTTTKTRYVQLTAEGTQRLHLRVDREVKTPIQPHVEARWGHSIDVELFGYDLVIVSDYGKGVCTDGLLRRAFARARILEKLVIVDPLRADDYSKYHGAGCLTPNRDEIRSATGLPVTDPDQAIRAGEALRSQLDAEAVIVTLDCDGMVLVHRDGRRRIFPTQPRLVCDPTGAGDTVVSILALCLAATIGYEPAIRLGNLAGGLVVERMGVCAPTWAELLREAQEEEVVEQARILVAAC